MNFKNILKSHFQSNETHSMIEAEQVHTSCSEDAVKMMSTIKELLIKQAEVGNTVLHHEVSCKCPFPDRFQWFLITNDRSWDTPSTPSGMSSMSSMMIGKSKKEAQKILKQNRGKMSTPSIYDKNHVPEDWQDVMNGIRRFVPDDGNFVLLDNKSFYSVKGNTDMTFYSIDVWGSGRSYYYFSHDDTLKPGDRVIVPFGSDNEQRYGTITKIEYFSPDSLPYPAEKTKYIERRLEPDEKIPEKTVYCPVIENEINGTDCMTITDVADKLMPVSELWDEVTWNEEQRSRCLACKWHHDSIEYAKKSNNKVATQSSDFTEQDVIDAHRFSGSNQEELSKGEKCGCFYCGKIFNSKEISCYLTDDNDCDRGGTAFCPYCEIDSVIGESSGYPITEEFLTAMNKKWF